MTRKEWEDCYYKLRSLFSLATTGIVKDSALYKALGPVAWMRFGAGEVGPDSNKDSYVYAAGYMEGVRSTLVSFSWCPELTDDLRQEIKDRFGSRFYNAKR